MTIKATKKCYKSFNLAGDIKPIKKCHISVWTITNKNPHLHIKTSKNLWDKYTRLWKEMQELKYIVKMSWQAGNWKSLYITEINLHLFQIQIKIK